MKSYTQLKKEASQYSWELYIYSDTGLAQDNQHHKYMNAVRKIEKLQSNAVKFEGGSWLYFPKASDIEIKEYLYNKEDIIISFKETNMPILSYHLRPIVNELQAV